MSATYIHGYLAPKKKFTPPDPPRTLGIGLRLGLRGVRFLVSEVPLYIDGASHVSGAPTGGFRAYIGGGILFL